MTYYFDMDGVLADFHRNYTCREQACSREYLATLPPFLHNIALLKGLLAEGNQVYILTEAATEDAKMGKIDWLAEYIPEVSLDRFICIVGHGKKVLFMKEEGVLIDDNKRHTNAWIKAGYEAILIERGAKIPL